MAGQAAFGFSRHQIVLADAGDDETQPSELGGRLPISAISSATGEFP